MMRDTARIAIRLRGLVPALFAAVLAGCGSPCPDGVLDDSLIVEDDEYFLPGGALTGRWSLGRVGRAGIEDCREIHGSVLFNGDVSDFSDFDGLEYVTGGISFRETGYPVADLAGRPRPVEVMDGMNALVRVEGAITSGPLIRGMSSLEYAGRVQAPSAGFYSLREVAGDLKGGAGGGTLAHLGNLVHVGGDFGSSAGDLDALHSLTTVGGNLNVSGADIVSFTPPVLEEVGGDLTVQQNEEIIDVDVPLLERVGGRLTFYSNLSPTPTLPEMLWRAFELVEIGNGSIICANAPNDPCPFDPDCLDHYGGDYCCPPEMDFEACVLLNSWQRHDA